MRDHRFFADIVHMNITGATELTTPVAAEIEDLGLRLRGSAERAPHPARLAGDADQG